MIDLIKYNPQITQFKGGSNPINIVEINHAKFVFKETNKTSENMHITEPLISQYLAESPCKRFVPYYSAKFNDKTGALSKYFLEGNQREVKYREVLEFLYWNNLGCTKDIDYKFSKEETSKFYDANRGNKRGKYFMYSIFEIILQIKTFCKLYNIDVDVLKLESTLTETAIYDFFLGNEDRNWQNISFIVTDNNGKKTLSQSPMFDHEFCLNMYYYYNKLVGLEHEIQYDDCNYLLALQPHFLPRNRAYNSSTAQKIMAQDIMQEASNNKDVQKQVQYCLNFDAKKFIDKFEKDENIKLSDEYKQIVLYAFNSKINLYKQTQQDQLSQFEK